MLVIIKETSESNFAASEEIRQISADNFAQVFSHVVIRRLSLRIQSFVYVGGT